MAESHRPNGGPSPDPRPPVTPDIAGSSPPTLDGGDAHTIPEGVTPPSPPPRRAARRRGKRYVPADQERRAAFTPEQRLLILDAWQRSGLPARDFAPLVGLSRHTLYAWKQRFEQQGPGRASRPTARRPRR